MRWQVPRRIEMRRDEKKQEKRAEREKEKEGGRDEEKGVGARRKGAEREGEAIERIAGHNGHDITIGITRAEK